MSSSESTTAISLCDVSPSCSFENKCLARYINNSRIVVFEVDDELCDQTLSSMIALAKSRDEVLIDDDVVFVASNMVYESFLLYGVALTCYHLYLRICAQFQNISSDKEDIEVFNSRYDDSLSVYDQSYQTYHSRVLLTGVTSLIYKMKAHSSNYINSITTTTTTTNVITSLGGHTAKCKDDESLHIITTLLNDLHVKSTEVMVAYEQYVAGFGDLYDELTISHEESRTEYEFMFAKLTKEMHIRVGEYKTRKQEFIDLLETHRTDLMTLQKVKYAESPDYMRKIIKLNATHANQCYLK